MYTSNFNELELLAAFGLMSELFGARKRQVQDEPAVAEKVIPFRLSAPRPALAQPAVELAA